MRKIQYVGRHVKHKRGMAQEILGLSHNEIQREVKIELIQALVPLGLLKVQELLEEEVKNLAGEKYERKEEEGYYRWTEQWGSVYIGDQKVPISYQRVRKKNGKEAKLEIYERFKKPRDVDERLLMKVLHGLSCRRYKECCEMVPLVFGFSPSTVSRRFKGASKRKLREFVERKLDKYDIVAIVIDGKTFQEDEMIIALGITVKGEKVLIGFIQAATENASVCRDFLWSILNRGLRIENGILCVIDGSKGLRKAVKDVFCRRVLVQRCQWHKRENVISYLPKRRRDYFRKALQRAYEKPTYEEAKSSLDQIKGELSLINESAVSSLNEGLEETLTLHRLGLFEELGKSLKTTNCLESLMALVGEKTAKVDYWRNSNQKHRWLAAALLDIEPRLNRIKGYRYLPDLREALKRGLRIKEASCERKGVALV
jgi:putative transposase